ncbi:glutamate-1-semialdehyde 2,1-aminomutase-like [Amphiura filiformis]|uniref:glutamate-1-semialdehyde 2,1-aminomutase-like n=1 Tax=Amphiura filiformis TaxID=82378 RepID=UPI003B21D1C6
MGWGTALVGHARDEVVNAVKQQCELGSNFAYVNDKALELAEELVNLSPAMEQMRFCASGTEATMYCMRLARAITGKKKILKFEGAYHGGNDEGTISLFPRHYKPYPQAETTSAGIDHVKDSVLVAPYNQLFQIQSILKEHADDIAAVIVEPLHRCTTPLPGFLESLREMTTRHDILLIFDEVVTGFRLALGGAQEYYGVIPDLVAYGKALGGGYPIGVFGGKQEIMRLVSEDLMDRDNRYVWTASSLGGNPICCSAALAALDIYKQQDTYKQLHEIGAYLREGMQHCLDTVGVTGYVIGDGPLAQILHTEKMVHDYSYREQKRLENAKQRRHTMLGLFRRGIFLNPMGTKLYLSLKHTKEDCDHFLKCLKETLEVFKEMSKE